MDDKETIVGYLCMNCATTYFAPEDDPDALPRTCPDCYAVEPWYDPHA